jgi:H+/Cl- antiporter ClcA
VARAKIPAPQRPVSPLQNVYTKHNITTMMYYINIYMLIGAIVGALVILMNNYFVKYDDGTPLTNKDVVITIFFWPIFLGFLFYYFFVKKDLDV